MPIIDSGRDWITILYKCQKGHKNMKKMYYDKFW